MLDLFKPIVPADKWHPNFKRISGPGWLAEQKVITGWSSGFVDRDHKFVIEFQTTFNSSFWELYLNAVFHELGFQADFSFETPDFLIHNEHQRFSAEAVIASNPDGHRPEWDRDPNASFDRSEMLRIATLRLARAVKSKHDKYINKYRHLNHTKDLPFIICVAPFEQPGFFAQNAQAMTRVLYGFDEPLTVGKGVERVIVGESRMVREIKDSGEIVKLGLFCDDSMAEVSAIVYSNTATFSKVRALNPERNDATLFLSERMNIDRPVSDKSAKKGKEYRETLLDGLHVFINPFASRPMDIRPLMHREIALHTYDPAAKTYVPHYPNGFLLQRSTQGIIPLGPEDFEKAEREAETEAKTVREYKTPTRPTWKEGELIDAQADTILFSDNHLAHWRGWTILIAKHNIDKDWMAQAVKKPCYSVPEFSQANGDSKIDSFISLESAESKEEALRQAINEIAARTAKE